MVQNFTLLVYKERHEALRREGARFRLASEAANWQPGYSRLYHLLWATGERLILAASTRQTERKVIAAERPPSAVRLPENPGSRPTRRAA